jgi:hypothetical protein
MMHAYYEKWKFKHPLPNDFKNHVESFTGKDLSWFFDGVLSSTQKMDYKIVGRKKDIVTIRNKTGFVVPLSVSDNNNNKLFEGFEGKKNFEFRISNQKFDKLQNIVIDQKTTSIDLYKQNNSLKKPFSYSFFTSFRKPE